MAELAGIGQYKTVDPKFVRSAKAEADAMKTLGLTKEYIESRGGVNASGFYGDSWSSSKNLTPEEYDAVIKGALAKGLTGAQIGSAINSATDAKSTGGTVNPQTGQWSGGTLSSGGGGSTSGGSTGGDSSAAAAKLKAEQDAAAAAETKRRAGQSAFDLLKSQFAAYGLEGLVSDVEKYIKDGLSQAEFTLRLRTESDAYKKRFAANQQRIAKGLRALSEAEYTALEDQYQNVMRNYGLPESYYAKGEMGVQPGFEKFLAGDVSATELEDRIQTAQNRVINAAPEVSRALREFYPDISNGDILAYALDPQQALTNIKRKVTAAEIGGAAMAEGLATGLTRAEELQRQGVTGAAYRGAAPFIKQAAERGSQLTSFYDQGQFDQATAEQAALGISGSAEAQKKIKKLTELEQASFSGSSGRAGGALARERAGQF